MNIMSKEIKITIVLKNDKENISDKEEKEQFCVVTHDSSMTIMSTLLQKGLIEGSFCGGRGDCGRCRVQFLKGITAPTAIERNVMTAEELRQGYRLACLARPTDDCVIRLEHAEEKKIAIISNMIDVTQKYDQISQQKDRTKNQKADVSANYETTDVIIAVDLGTTTIAMQLMEIGTGRIIDTYCEMNPQRRYGSDVLSRIQASCDGHREMLQRLVSDTLERGVIQFRKKTDRIGCMCIAGNTAMEHLLMGYDVLSLGYSPFVPVEIGLQEYEFPGWDFKVWITPGISAFVGGDIVAGLYALHLLPKVNRDKFPDKKTCDFKNEVVQYRNQSDQRRAVRLLIDLGTNGEMAITDGIVMIVTATAAGPAFEGGAGAGIIGSDMIANVAKLLRQGVLDETGLLCEPYFSEGISVGDPAVCLRNTDVRNLQMAKAAVRAGIEILWKKMGCPAIEHVYLAGGFGYYLNVEAAFRIGLLPEHMRGKVTAVGNTSLSGAYHIGCDLLQDETAKERLEEGISSIISVNLAEQEEFEELYVRYMNLKTM